MADSPISVSSGSSPEEPGKSLKVAIDVDESENLPDNHTSFNRSGWKPNNALQTSGRGSFTFGVVTANKQLTQSRGPVEATKPGHAVRSSGGSESLKRKSLVEAAKGNADSSGTGGGIMRYLAKPTTVTSATATQQARRDSTRPMSATGDGFEREQPPRKRLTTSSVASNTTLPVYTAQPISSSNPADSPDFGVFAGPGRAGHSSSRPPVMAAAITAAAPAQGFGQAPEMPPVEDEWKIGAKEYPAIWNTGFHRLDEGLQHPADSTIALAKLPAPAPSLFAAVTSSLATAHAPAGTTTTTSFSFAAPTSTSTLANSVGAGTTATTPRTTAIAPAPASGRRSPVDETTATGSLSGSSLATSTPLRSNSDTSMMSISGLATPTHSEDGLRTNESIAPSPMDTATPGRSPRDSMEIGEMLFSSGDGLLRPETEGLMNVPVANAADELDLDLLQGIRHREAAYMPRADYMDTQDNLSAHMRGILVDWMMEVAEEYGLHRETWHIAVNYLDRFLAASKEKVEKNHLQLVGVTALSLASKLEEIYPPEIKSFSALTDGMYSAKQMLVMERLMLNTLAWNLWPPTGLFWIMLHLKTFFRLRAFNDPENSVQYEGHIPPFTRKLFAVMMEVYDTALMHVRTLCFPPSLLSAGLMHLTFPSNMQEVTQATGFSLEEILVAATYLRPFAEISANELTAAANRSWDNPGELYLKQHHNPRALHFVTQLEEGNWIAPPEFTNRSDGAFLPPLPRLAHDYPD